ncbi:butyrophilin subfamily 3 member A2 isoform X4 [Oreochromis niloticus]|uniref:butyrophilin subfamily 3 member A2 isoform X4 n=2 Tax=Oreochromis niloticus TaxID=8128 RepID=UPI000DF48FD5|nr:butyrophilin subfamily 3 member A2 isoform X4 [Oreochromis niloticus]
MYDAGDHYNNGRPGQDKQFKARVSHLEEELKHGNASIRINNTRVSDSGNYTCYFPRLNPPRTFSVQLVVSPSYMDRLAENILGASMTPYTAILNATEDGVTLRCEVPGVFPKPKLEWQDSDGNVLPAEEPRVSEKRGRYYVSLRSTVSRTTTNLFVCVARQEDIHHQTKAEIYVPEKMFEECRVSDQISGQLECCAWNSNWSCGNVTHDLHHQNMSETQESGYSQNLSLLVRWKPKPH